MEETTISDLYEKYTNQVGEALEDDRYFQYLFEMIQAGDNTLAQKNRVLHKVIDEKWLTVVEEGIESIFNIVDKPRRFITTTEEVVPVALAKKITADSVRHLSQHTQFITENAAGEIQPTRILNVTTEESYDLYENRFVYHLIQRLFAFVDKRTDIIFWSTGDETCSVMSMESKVDDAYEEISYKVEMTIKNRQSYVESDSDHMDLFKRIDRVRRLSRTLRASSFCDIMNGCARVHSPIQRTNLMMKDPDYRTCYRLWQFIESYDEVGYSIEERDSALQFDEEYLLQMYINFITNYTVFKSILEADPRKVTELAAEKREPVRPKFVKKIEEQIVEDRDIPDVEIRKVFVEEVTQAQLDAEAKLEEETKRREELERSLSELEFQMDSLNQQMEFLEQTRMQLEQERADLDEQLHKEQKTRRETEEAMAAADIEARNAIEMAQAEARESIEKIRAEEKHSVENLQTILDTVRKEKEHELTAAQERAEKAEKDAKNSRKEKEKKLKAATEEIDKIRKEASETEARIRKESRAAITAAQREAAKAVEEARCRQEEAESQVQKALAQAESASLSHYIVKRLQERRESKRKKDDSNS